MLLKDVFKNGFASVSLGYIGVHETVQALYGEKMWGNAELQQKGLEIVKHLREAVDRWKAETGYGFGLYSTPSESLCNRFCKLDVEEFGEIEEVTDKGYYTNSFHLDVRENTIPFEKMLFEHKYPEYASGGFISYVELNSLVNNIEALEKVWDFAYRYIPYFAINTPCDKCFECGFEGEFTTTTEGYSCPNCGNNDPTTVSVVKRTCGYLSDPCARPYNTGKQIEVYNRVKHM